MAIKNIFKKKQWKADYEAGRDAFNAGQFKPAETHLRSAMMKAIDLDDSSYGDTALLLGQVMRRLERFDESLELTEKSFRYYLGMFGATDSRTVQAHLSLALADPHKSDEDPALRQATYHKAVEQFGPKTWQLVRTAALALPHLTSAEREKALGQAQDAFAYILGEGRGDLGAWPPVAEEFALRLSELGYHDLAARFMGSQLRVHEERFGDKSEEAALTRLNLGEFFLRCGEWAKAETALSKALEQIKLKHGAKSDLARQAVISLGQALARQGRLEQAAPYLTDSLDKLRPDQVQERLEALVWLLEYKCMVQASDAERGALWRELEQVWESHPTEEARARIYQGFGAAQRRLQEAWELAAADRFLQAVLNRVRQWRGPHHPDVAATMMDLGLCAAMREDDAKAMSYAEQSLALDEGVDNLIRSMVLYGELGERERALQSSKLALRLIRGYSPGLEQGRRQAVFANALLRAGDVEGAIEHANAAIEQLPDSEQDAVRVLVAEAHVLNGGWAQAERLYKQSLPRLTEPVARARAYLQMGWLLCQTGRFPEMQDALTEVQSLASLRREHPILIAAKAVAAQGAFYSGNIYQGKEERDAVFAFLRKGQHQQTRRALAILTLLDPFGPDEFVTELDVGTQILAAGRYPEAVCSVFPTKDAACIGLRHLTRALFFHGQEGLAQERLSQFKERFADAYSGLSNPLAFSMYLCAAQLATNPSEKCEALEAARRGLRELGARHVNLFPTLSLMAETYIEVGAVEKAKFALAEALSIRKSGRLKEWLAMLERGELPTLPVEATLRDSSAELAPSEAEPAPIPVPDLLSAVEETPVPDRPEPDRLEPVAESPADYNPDEFMDEPEETLSRPPAALRAPSAYQEAPQTEDETPAAPIRAAIPPELENIKLEDSGTLVAFAGASDVSQIPLALALAERDDPPTQAEVRELMDEVQARFGDDRRARHEAQLMLALLHRDGSEQGLRLWNEGLEGVFREDFETLLQLETRARDANASGLVLATLQRRLSDEVGRYGEQATESIDTLLRMARTFESRGQLDEAYQRILLTTEILRSWFGARSRRLLEPLAAMIRLAEKRDDVPLALEHHLERHRLLEGGQSNPEELFSSRIALLPIRALLGQVDELMAEAATSQSELAGLGPAAGVEFGSVLLTTALRLERMHWRVQEAARLLEMAIAAVPDREVSLSCRLQIAFAECQSRRDYRAQADTIRKKTVDRAASLESESRAEVLHEAAESCLRVRELPAAREIAEKLLEERIAGGGRKDQWAGRALLVLAEADLKSYRLEGTETAIAMSRPSLEGSSFWVKAQLLKAQSDFFLGREADAFATIDAVPTAEALELQLPLAVWRGQAEKVFSEMTSEGSSPLAARWRGLDKAPLDDAVLLLEFLARAGRVRHLHDGLLSLLPRLHGVLPTDSRLARINLLRGVLQLWEGRWSDAEQVLQRVLDSVPAERVELPEGLSVLLVRGMLVTSLLAQNKVKQAEAHARAGAAEAAELLGEEDIRSVAFRAQSAYCAEGRGDLEEALVVLDEVLAPLQDRLGESHVLLRDVYRGLSRAFSDQDLESARLTAEEALRIDKECRGLSIHFLEDLYLLSQVERHEVLDEARTLIDSALELSSDVLTREHPFVALLEADRQALDQMPEPVGRGADAEADEESFEEDEEEEAVPTVAAALVSARVEDEEEDEVEASLDGWEVVEESAEDSVEEALEDSAEGLFGSQEEFVEDSVLEAPAVAEAREAEETPEELEMTPEEAAEELSIEFEPEVAPLARVLDVEDVSDEEEEGGSLFEDEVDSDFVEVAEEAAGDDEELELELTEEEAAEMRAFEAEQERAAEAEAEAARLAAEVAEAGSVEETEDVAQAESVEDSEEVAEAESVEESEEVAEAESVEESQEVAEAESVEESEEVADAESAGESEEVAEAESVEESEEVAEAESVEDSDEVAEAESVEESEEVAEADAVEEQAAAFAEIQGEEPALAETQQAPAAEDAVEGADAEVAEPVEDVAEADAPEEPSGDVAEAEIAAEPGEDVAEAVQEQAEAFAEIQGEEHAMAESQDAVEAEEPTVEAGEAALETAHQEEVYEPPSAGPISAAPTSYKSGAAYYAAPRATSASVEGGQDFPTVPYRAPVITDEIQPESAEQPGVAEAEVVQTEVSEAEVEVIEQTEAAPEAEVEIAEAEETEAAEAEAEAADAELVEAQVSETESDAAVSEQGEDEAESQEASSVEAPVAETRPEDEPVSEQAEDEATAQEWVSDEIPSEVSQEESAEGSVSLEQMAQLADPEASLLPLAPVFFLPLPWKEATEASFDEDYEGLHERFQEQFSADDADWRETVDEAVSLVRLEATPEAGYFLFLIGAQLEKGGRLHIADLCLATAIELLESGPALGAACHMAGRVAGRRGELRRALDYFDRAAELADEPELAVLKVDAAECHLGLGRPEEALIGFEEVFEYLQDNVPKVQSLAVQAKMAQIHLLIGDPDSSQMLAEDVLSQLSPKNDGTYRVLGRVLLSRAFARLGRHELALDLAEQAWDGARSWSAKRREGRRIAISNLVDIYCVAGKFDKAEDILRESGLLGWGLAESELLLRAGHVACALGKLPQARSYLRLGQSFLTRFRSPALWRSAFLELGAELALQQGDAGRADQLSRQAMELFEQEATGPVDRSRHLVRASRIAGAMGDMPRARKMLEEAHSLRDLHLGAAHPHTESVDGIAAVLK